MRADVEEAQHDRGSGAVPDPSDGNRCVLVRLVGYPPTACAALTALLGADGYTVVVDGEHRHEAGPADVVLVDLGREPAGSLAAIAHAGLATVGTAASRLPEERLLAAYAAGLDLVLVGELRPRELIARIRALVRALPAPRARPSRPERSAGACTSITFSPAAGVATVSGRTVPLTDREGRVLEALLRRSGGVVTRAELASAAADQQPGALDAIVRGVRSKLEAIEGRRRIVTVRGVGFRLLADR